MFFVFNHQSLTILKKITCFVLIGLAVSEGNVLYGLDRKPFTTLLYGNGEGYQGPDTTEIEPHTRQNLTSINTGIRFSEIMIK